MASSGFLSRGQSAEDLLAGVWRLGGPAGRTPSEIDFSTFLAQGGLILGDGSNGIPRVASMDQLRELLLRNQSSSQVGDAGGVAAAPSHAFGPVSSVTLPRTFGAAAAAAPAALPAQLPDWGAVLAGSRAAEPARDGPATGGGPASGGRGRSSAPAKKESARAKTVRERAARSKAAKAADTEEEVDEGDEEEMDEGEVLKSMGKGPFTAEEIRRQRRMLSNRESARRSRRRKLEHVHTLQGQIDVLRAEGAAVAAKLREAEQRADAAARENRGLKAEVERLHSIAARAAADGCGGSLLGSGEPVKRIASLPRIASAEHIAKRMREAAAGEGAGNESPRGFVPFRSIRSFENLAGLGVTGSAGQQHTAVAASGGGL